MRVLVWTVPRAVSTAFERALMEHPQTSVHHEPFSLPWYFGPRRISRRYTDQPPRPGATLRAAMEKLRRDPAPVMIAKVMAYCANAYRDRLRLDDFIHTALIRHPGRTVPSLWRASHDTQGTGWDHFDEREVGYADLFEMLQVAEAATGRAPIILDADDLLERPSDGLRAWCDAVGIDYTPDMLTWEPGPVPAWDIWPGWHDNAALSRGLLQKVRSPIPRPPGHLAGIVSRAMGYYRRLHSRRLRF